MATGDRKRRMTGCAHFDGGYLAETTASLVLKALQANDLSKAALIIASQAGHHDNSNSSNLCLLAGEVLSRMETVNGTDAFIAAQAMYKAAEDGSNLADTLERWHDNYLNRAPVRPAPALTPQ